MKILEILSHRRIWIVFVGLLALIFPSIGIDVDKAADSFVNLFQALADIIMIALAMWSILKPKLKKQ